MFSALNFYITLRTLNVVCPPPPLLHSLMFLKYCKNFTGVQNMLIYFKLHKLHILRAVKSGGVPGVTTPGPGPKRGPDTNCYKFTSTARYEVKLIAD